MSCPFECALRLVVDLPIELPQPLVQIRIVIANDLPVAVEDRGIRYIIPDHGGVQPGADVSSRTVARRIVLPDICLRCMITKRVLAAVQVLLESIEAFI